MTNDKKKHTEKHTIEPDFKYVVHVSLNTGCIWLVGFQLNWNMPGGSLRIS